MKHFLHALGRRALTLAVAVGFCSGVWADKVVYYTPDGTFYSDKNPSESGTAVKSNVSYSITDDGVINQIGYSWGASGDFKTVTIPDEIGGIRVTKIASYASDWCQGLEKMVFPKYLVEIGHHMIAYNKSSSGYSSFGITTLATLDFSKVDNFAALTIADDAFAGCTALLTGDNGKFIYQGYDTEYAGGGQTGVTYTICPKTHAMGITDFASVTPVLRIDGSRKVNNEIYGTDCRLNGMLKNAVVGGNNNKNLENVEQIMISEGLTTLGDGEFDGCKKLVLLVLPKSCDFNNFVSADDQARCGASIFNNMTPPLTLAFSSGVPYRFKMSGSSWTATVDCGSNLDGKYQVESGEYNRTPQADGDIKFYPTIEFVKGYKATFESIPDNAFAGNTDITSALVGGAEADANQIASIGANAFKGCTGMKNFEMTSLPAKSITFGTSCFEGCTGLTAIDFATRFIAADATTGLQLPAGFLKGCKNIRQLSFGNEIAEDKIGDEAVANDSGNDGNKLCVVKFVKTSGTLTAYYTWFHDKKSGTDVPFQLDDATIHGQTVVENGSTLASSVVLKKVVNDDSADLVQNSFSCNENVSFYSKGNISGGLETVCDECFAQTKMLNSVSVPQNIRRMGDNCFNPSVLENLNLTTGNTIVVVSARRPADATDSKEMAATVSGGAIQSSDYTLPIANNCSNIKYFVTELGDSYLRDSKNLRTFTVDYNAAPTAFAYTLAVDDNALRGCTALTKISLGSAVTKIGANAFSGCTAMKSLVVDWKNLQTIGDGAFGGCDNIHTFVFDCNVIKTKTQGDVYDKILSNIHGADAEDDIYIVNSNERKELPGVLSNYYVIHASGYRYMPLTNMYSGGQTVASSYGTVCLPYQIDRDRSYNLRNVYKAQLNADATAVNLVHQNTIDLKSGVPYIFERYATDSPNGDPDNLVVFAAENSSAYVPAPVNSDDNILTGTFVNEAAEDGDYVLQSDNKFHIVETSSYAPVVGAYRSYIKASSLPASVSPAALLSLNIGGSATGIGGINASGNAGANAAGTKIYTIDGQRVYAPVKGQVYIIGGKKRVY